MDSDFQQQQYQHHFQDLQRQFHHQKQQLNSLTRFRSAPSSYFATFLDADHTNPNPGEDRPHLSNPRADFSTAPPLSPDTENIFSRFMSTMDDANKSPSHKSTENSPMQPESMVRVKQESDTLHQQQQQQKPPPQHGNYTTAPQMMYQSASKPPLANHHTSAANSVGMSSTPHMTIGIGGITGNNGSSLTRHSSSPAGFFDNLVIDGYGVMRGLDNYGGGSASREQVDYSSGLPSSTSTSGLVRQNSEVETKTMRMNSLEETKFSNFQNNDGNYNTGLPMSSWNDSIMSETFSSLDGGDDGRKISSEQISSDYQTGESTSRPPSLAHHLSLPNTSAELSAMEKLLHLQDSVPLRMRAKRGFATHPRSIAERVRRTKISERMRKLQDLVPNMDKQTNTTDMLDLAVDYIKDLQKQVKNLHDDRAKCTCSR